MIIRVSALNLKEEKCANRDSNSRPYYNESRVPFTSSSLIKALKKNYTNLSNRSFVALHIGHIPGGCSRAQRYPQTLQRQTGRGKIGFSVVEATLTGAAFPRWDRGGRRSGMGATFCLPVAIASFTYRAQ
jgi:hypothetical protein